MFAMACIDRQNEIDRQKKDKLEKARKKLEEKQRLKIEALMNKDTDQVGPPDTGCRSWVTRWMGRGEEIV